MRNSFKNPKWANEVLGGIATIMTFERRGTVSRKLDYRFLPKFEIQAPIGPHQSFKKWDKSDRSILIKTGN